MGIGSILRVSCFTDTAVTQYLPHLHRASPVQVAHVKQFGLDEYRIPRIRGYEKCGESEIILAEGHLTGVYSLMAARRATYIAYKYWGGVNDYL